MLKQTIIMSETEQNHYQYWGQVIKSSFEIKIAMEKLLKNTPIQDPTALKLIMELLFKEIENPKSVHKTTVQIPAEQIL